MKIDISWEIGIKWFFYKNAELKNTQGKLSNIFFKFHG